MPYIYKIVNDINEQIYIGKTEDTINNRWSKHLWNCKNQPGNIKLYNAMNKYGINHFHILMIEKCDSSVLAEREKYWISFYDSYYNGYNLTPGGDGCPKYDRNQVLTLWKQGYSQKQISEKLKCERHTVSRILNGLNIPKEERIKYKTQGNAAKEILLLDKDTSKVILEFSSAANALRYLNLDSKKCSSAVSRACKDQNKTAYGYKWILKKDYQNYKNKEKIKYVETG